MRKKQKFIYWLIGLGSGIMVSGLVITFVGLNIKPLLEETSILKNTQEAAVFKTQEKYNNNNNEDIIKSNVVENTTVLTKVKSKEELANEDNMLKENYKWVDIPHSYNANQISTLLEKEGIIESAADFSKFVKEQKMTTKLMSGKQYLPINGDYEILLNLLKVNYKN